MSGAEDTGNTGGLPPDVTLSNDGNVNADGSDPNTPKDMTGVDVDQKVADLEARIATLEAEKAQAETNAATVQQNYDTVSADLAAANQQITELKARVEDQSAAVEKVAPALDGDSDDTLTAAIDDHLANNEVPHHRSVALAGIRQAAIELRAKIWNFHQTRESDAEMQSPLGAVLHRTHYGI